MKTWLFAMFAMILFLTTTAARADLCSSCQQAGRDQCCNDRSCREVCRKTDRAPILGGGVNVLGFRLGGSFDLNRTRTGVDCQDGHHCRNGYGLGVRLDAGLPGIELGGGGSNCRTHHPTCPPPRRPSCNKPVAPMPPNCAMPRRHSPMPQRQCCGGGGCLDCQPERYSWLANYGRSGRPEDQFSGYQGQRQQFSGGDRSRLVPASQPMPYRRLVTVPTYDPQTRTTGFKSYYRTGVE